MIDTSNVRVGVLTLEIHFPGSQSLKSKRKLVQRVKDRVRSQFNASIAEVDALDKWQRGVLAVSVVANDAAYLDQQFQKIVELVESCGDLYIAASDVGVM